MRWHRFGHRLRGILLAAVALAGMSGCMSFLHPIEPLTPQQCTAFQACPSCSQGHVYIFMVHGLDPLDYANLAGVLAITYTPWVSARSTWASSTTLCILTEKSTVCTRRIPRPVSC